MGKEIRFWDDCWIGDQPLREVFRNLHAIDPKGWVSDVFDEEINIWRLQLRRHLNDWEVGDLGNLLALIEGSKPSPLRRDSWE